MRWLAGRKWPFVVGVLLVGIVVLVAVWNWDWFRPLVEAQASSALGRKVTVSHLHVHPGWTTEIAVDDVAIDEPEGFAAPAAFATIKTLTVAIDVSAYLHRRVIVLPVVALDHPVVNAVEGPDGRANWNFPALASKPPPAGQPSAPPPEIGELRISDGQAHVVAAPLKADFQATIATSQTPGSDPQIVMDAKGTYAAQAITARFVGGALLTLQDSAKPYPVDLKIANGQTHVSLVGTIRQPLTFGGADLKLELVGANMADLYPLTAIPIPATPSYSIAGRLDYGDRKIRFSQFSGRVGSSDLNGDLEVDPTGARPVISGNLTSRRIDLVDLAGFVGSTPGRVGSPDQTAAQRRQVQAADASPKLFPTTPINLPKIRAADFHIKYRGEHIIDRSVPLDNLVVQLDIVDGAIRLHPLNFGVGGGQIVSEIALDSEQDQVHVKADVDFRRLDLSRIMEATHLFHGSGVLGGRANIDTTGNSLSAMLGHGNGGVTLLLSGKGDLSALLADLAGLQLGDAVLSALGIPSRADLECFIGDFGLKSGVLTTRTLLLDTSETRVTGSGDIDLGREAIDYRLSGEAKHFTVGAFRSPIGITGTLKNPSIRPDVGPLAAKAGLAAGLGVLFPPLALLPTIELGIGEDSACARALHGEHAEATPKH